MGTSSESAACNPAVVLLSSLVRRCSTVMPTCTPMPVTRRAHQSWRSANQRASGRAANPKGMLMRSANPCVLTPPIVGVISAVPSDDNSSAKPPMRARHNSSAPAPKAMGAPRSPCGSTPRSACTSSMSGQATPCCSTTSCSGTVSSGPSCGCARATPPPATDAAKRALPINRRGSRRTGGSLLHRAGSLLSPFVALHADDVVDLLLLLFALEPHRRHRDRVDVAGHAPHRRLRQDDLALLGDRAQARRRVHRVADGRVLQRARRSDRAGDDASGVDADADLDRLL